MNYFCDKLQHYSAGRILDFGTGSGGSARVIMDAVKEYESVTGISQISPLRQTAETAVVPDRISRIEPASIAQEKDQEEFLRKVFFLTLDNWKGSVALDLAIIFDKTNCGLKCFLVREFDPVLCETTIDCLGFYKVQKGFTGFVTGPAVDCSRMYPFVTVWKRDI